MWSALGNSAKKSDHNFFLDVKSEKVLLVSIFHLQYNFSKPHNITVSHTDGSRNQAGIVLSNLHFDFCLKVCVHCLRPVP